MSPTINIIEPLLLSEVGHYYSYVKSLCQANDSSKLVIWGGKNAPDDLNQLNTVCNNYFIFKLRRPQILFLLRRLFKAREKIFFSTAGTTELLLVYLASWKPVPPNTVYLYLHKVGKRGERKKMNFYRKAARKHPNIVMLGPTTSIVDFLKECGFKNARLAPHPVFQPPELGDGSAEFNHVVFAGSSSREEKGFPFVVDFVQFLNQNKYDIPVELQLKDDLNYPEDTLPHAKRLLALDYPHLRKLPADLPATEYYKIFTGGICLQLYDKYKFADRISGVTFDALMTGCPIVALAGFWGARMVKRFDAGVVVENTDPELVSKAVKQIIDDYKNYQRKAYAGGKILANENSATHLLKILSE